MGRHEEAARAELGVEALDAAAVHLARGEARWRLRLGEVADALLSAGRHHTLGFADVHQYAREQLGTSAAWLYESRRVAARLRALPATRRALARGEITWKMAELLGRRATPEEERVVLVAARRSTLREMAELLDERDEAGRAADEERMVTVTRRVDVDTFWDCEVTSKLVDHLEGREVGSRWIEAVVGEATSTFQNAGVDPFIASVAGECRSWDARRREAERMRERLERACEEDAEASGRPLWDRGEVQGLGPIEGPIPDDAHALDAMLRGAVFEMNRQRLALGDVAGQIRRRRGWEALGCGSFAQWIRERLGLGRATVMRRIRLAADAERLPEIGVALRRGQTSEAAAMLVGRVADQRTVGEWLGRTVRRTYAHLREEVEIAERRAGVRGTAGARTGVWPPNEAEVARFSAEERAVSSGERLRQALDEEGLVSFREVGEEGVEDGPVSLRRVGGPRTREVRFRIPLDAFIELRMMEVAFSRSGVEGVFLRVICRLFWREWLPWLGKSDRWEHIYRRDGYRCTCPVCTRRDVTLHHLKYRSRGGGDEAANVVSVCAFHHLDGEHGGRLKVTGRAGRMTWRLGPPEGPAVMVVVGRERVA